MLKTAVDFIISGKIEEGREIINHLLNRQLTEYIIEKGFWGNNSDVINEIIEQTINIVIDKISTLTLNFKNTSYEKVTNENHLYKRSKQICYERIKLTLKSVTSISELKDIIKNIATDDNKLNNLIKLKLNNLEQSQKTSFRNKLLRHEQLMFEYGLNINDSKLIEKAFVNYIGILFDL